MASGKSASSSESLAPRRAGSDSQADIAPNALSPPHARHVLLLVAMVAAIARVITFTWVVKALPHTLDTLEGFDAHTYRLWAERIAAGDWFSRKQGAFYYAPLYPTLVGWIVAVTGTATVLTAIVFNGVTGVLGSVCCAGAAMRRFGTTAGMVAGMMYALSGTQLAWESQMLGDALLASLTMAALWLMPDARHNPKRWLATGCLCALLVSGRASFLLPIILVTFWLVWGIAKEQAVLKSVAAFVLPVCLVAGGLCIRNGIVGDVWSVTTNGPVNLYLGNAPGSPGTFYPMPDFEQLQFRINRLDPRERGSAWRRELISRAAENPGAVAKGLLRKTAMFLSSWDAADNASYYFIRRYVPPMKGTFGPLAITILGYVSIGIMWREWHRHAPVLIFGAGFAASIILVFVAGRYKLPFTGMLCILCGAGTAAILRIHFSARVLVLTKAGGAAILAGLIAWPRPQPSAEYVDLLRPNEFFYAPAALARAERFAEAYRMSADGADLFPDFPRLRENAARYAALGSEWSDALHQTSLARHEGVATPLTQAIGAEAARRLGKRDSP